MKNRVFPIIIFLAILAGCSNSNTEISLSSLVSDLTDRAATPEYPNPNFSLKQYSSYDQNTVSEDQDGWYANHDASWFIRHEQNNGRREFVMLDSDGPGSIVRFWMTFGNEDAYTGTIRFYFDESDEPEIEGSVLDIISGGKLVGDPLSSSVSTETNYFQRGHNLYLPIPYSQHLKITYECPALDPVKHSPSVYYNINYRTYEEGTDVISFTMDELLSISEQIELVQNELKGENDLSIPLNTFKHQENTGKIAPGDKISMSFSGRNAIHKIEIRLNADDLYQALRSTVIEMVFDDEKTVWSPIGEFFGTGYKIKASKTWYTKVDDDGTMSCYWIMPFNNSAELNIINYGEQELEILSNSVWTDKYRWTNNSMHFGAIWQELREVETGGSSAVNGDDAHFDVNYVTLNGEGVYIGTGLTIFNTVDAWWGEGDEKIWVDGESFPSFIGTGTEDYFGYAWCRPEVFSHFLIAQPDGSGNFHPGMSVNLRFHILDGIPFSESIQFDMELWHWTKTIMNYAPMSYWYLKPGGSCNIEPNIEAVKLPVSLKKSDLIKPQPVIDGILEAENIRVIDVTKGHFQSQAIKEWNWSNNAQLWWIADSKDEILKGDFIMPKGGTYQVSLTYSKAIDYGNFKLAINDKYCSKTFIGYHDQKGKEVITKTSKLGVFQLEEGVNTITLKTVGTHPNSVARYMVGIDFLEFKLIQ